MQLQLKIGLVKVYEKMEIRFSISKTIAFEAGDCWKWHKYKSPIANCFNTIILIAYKDFILRFTRNKVCNIFSFKTN